MASRSPLRDINDINPSPNERSKDECITSRLLQAYTIIEGHCISLAELQTDIFNATGHTCSLHELGRHVKYALPWVTKVKRTVEVDGLKTRLHVYKDLCILVESYIISWDNMKNYVPPANNSSRCTKWSLSQSTENFVEWVSVSLDDKCNGQKIVWEIRIYIDFAFELYINSTKVTNLPVQNSFLNKKYYLDNIFMFVSNLSICNGFAVKTRRNTTNRAGETIGTTIDWVSCKAKEMRHRAVSCAMILKSHEIMCKSCSSIKVNSFYKTLKPCNKENLTACTSISKRESYMNPNEIKEKLFQEKKRRKIADRKQQQYNKLISEMKLMDDNDSADVKQIFDGINVEDLD